MKQVIVVGKTDSIINLNKVGVPIRGKIQAVLNINNEDQMNEITGLVRLGLLDILQVNSDSDVKQQEKAKVDTLVSMVTMVAVEENPQQNDIKTAESKNNKGRPKGSKNKSKNKSKPISEDSLAKEERIRMSKAESLTQQMGSEVIIGTLDGPKIGRMTRSAIDEIQDSEKTRASIEAMEKLEKEEKEDIELPDSPIDESKLDASEQMGRKAVISTEGGVENVAMVNSLIKESDSIRKADPFIDKKDKSLEIEASSNKDIKKEIKDPKASDDDFSDAFIRI